MRSLILAGGGVKVAYQAGCLQVLLDEAKLQFDHVDAASGGSFNLAMLMNGSTGTEIADHWRSLNPWDMIRFNWPELVKLGHGRSIATQESLVQRVYRAWGLDWDRIRACERPFGTFNVYNFGRKRLEVVLNRDMDQEWLNAAVALPMWFPPVKRGDDFYFDAVYCTDGNVGEAVRRGADEIWTIWTVADLPEYRDGFVAQYFHIIETVADTRFFQEWREIEAVNASIARYGADLSRPGPDLQLREGYASDDPDRRPPPGRKPVALHLIKQEVPVHYLLNISRDRLNEAVELGVHDAREYCRRIGLLPSGPVSVPIVPPHIIPTTPPPQQPTDRPPVSLEFTEEMHGFFAPGETNPREGGETGKLRGERLSFHVTMHMDDLDRFIREPEHLARATGEVTCPLIGSRMRVTEGTFNLFLIPDQGPTDNPAIRRMEYRLHFSAPDGTRFALEGFKEVKDDPGMDVWPDLTTLYTTLYRVEGAAREVFGAGILRLHPLDFVRELGTFRVHDAGSPAQAIEALSRFGLFFLGSAWDVYARHVIEYAPF